MSFNSKVYDVLKWLAQYLFPAVGTLYFALARIWNLPYAEEVVGSITAVDAFLGVLLGISSANFDGDGEISLSKVSEEDDDSSDEGAVVLYAEPEELAGRKSIVIKVAD